MPGFPRSRSTSYHKLRSVLGLWCAAPGQRVSASSRQDLLFPKQLNQIYLPNHRSFLYLLFVALTLLCRPHHLHSHFDTINMADFIIPTNISPDYQAHRRLGGPIHAERHVNIICVGAGASGLLMAYKLQKHFNNFTLTVYEKNPEVSGTWFENRYPG